MPTEPTRAPGSPPEASDGRRLHIHGIKEMPAGYDAEVAELFRDLRAASNLSEVDLAATLATRPEVVQALEQGALYALPPWPETSRVVNSYGLLLNLDVRPLLRRIYAQIEPSTAAQAQAQDPYAAAGPRPGPQAPPSRSPLDIPFETEQRVVQKQPYHEPARAPQQNWAPPPVDRRMQPRAPGAPMPGRQMPQMPQQQPQRPQQPNAPQARAAQTPPQPRPAQPQPQPPTRAPQTPPPRQQPAPQPSPASATMAPPAVAKAVPEKKGWWSKYLKWGIAALVLIAAAYGFFAFRSETGLVGTSNPSQSGEKAGKPSDPDDPRSHKSDRLPSPGL